MPYAQPTNYCHAGTDIIATAGRGFWSFQKNASYCDAGTDIIATAGKRLLELPKMQ